MARLLTGIMLWLALLAPALAQSGDDGAEDGGVPTVAAEPAGLAASAARYRDMILEQRPAQTSRQAAEAALAAARKAEAAQKLDLAIAEIEQAVAQGEEASGTWLWLGRLWLARPQADPDRAAQAAWLAYQAAGGKEARAEALLALADIVDHRLSRPGEALALLRRLEGEAPNVPGLAERIAELARRVGLEWRWVRVDAESDEPRVCLDFSGPLRKARGTRFEDFVASEPVLPLVAEASDQTLCLSGFAHGSRYRITVREGLPGEGGLVLRRSETREAAIGDRRPAVAFRGDGFILPRLGPQGVPVTTVNLDAVTLDVYRFGDRSLTGDIARRFPGGLDRWSAEQIAEQQGERIWSGRMAVRNERNASVVTTIPVDRLLGEIRPGLYVIVAAPADLPARDLPYIRATQWLLVSDVALGAMRGTDGLDVFARSLATAKPLPGTEMALVARNNAELARATADTQGRVHFDRALMRSTGGNEPVMVLAYGPEGDFTLLALDRPSLDLADRGVAGRPMPGPLDAFVYTDRGVYRPGERIHVTALLRDAQARAVAGVPLTLKVTRPNGTVLRSGVVAAAAPGMHVLGVELGKAAPLGTWTIAAFADPAAPPIGRAQVQVEEFVPERLAVEATPSAAVLEPGRPFAVEVEGRFLYGPPAAGLDGSVEVSLVLDPAPYAGHADYRFGLVQEEVTARTDELDFPTTDAEGRARVAVTLPPLPDTTRPLRAEIRIAVAEPGGRPSRAELAVPVRSQPFAIGIRPRFTGGQIDEGGEAVFDVVALGPDGKPLPRPGLKLELLAEHVVHQWYQRDGIYDYRTIIRSESLRRGTLDLTATGPAQASYGPLEYGRYRVEVSDPATGVASSVRFMAGWQAQIEAGDRPDKLDVAADKAAYRTGEVARLWIEGGFPGEMQVTVATDRVLAVRQLPLPKEGAMVELPVSADWGAGAYALVTAVRPPVAGKEHLPVRALGVAWLGIDPGLRTLAVGLPALAPIRPRQKLEVPVTVTGPDGAPAAGVPVTLAAVDEGILRLTGFAAPDPAGHYLGKRALGLDLRDDYGRLIDAGAGPLGELRQGGDQGGLGASLPVVPLTIVSLFQGPVTSDAQGVARFTLDLPDFNGELRLMAVAADPERLGAAHGTLTVRDPLVADLVLPRFLAPGDEAEATLSLHNVEATPGAYRVAVTGLDAVRVSGGDGEIVLDRGARATFKVRLLGAAAGIGRVQAIVEGPGGLRLAHELPIAVRPARPVETVFTRRQLPAGGETGLGAATLAAYVPGTGAVRLGYSATPLLDLAGTLAALERYPYGCLEQLTSRGLPLLVAGELDTAFARQREDGLALDARVDEAIAHVLDKQRFDGGFGVWSAYGEEDPWLTAYAMELLARARAKGRPVPDAAFTAGLERLERHAVDGGTEPRDLASRAYAVHVLALAGVATPQIARYLHDGFLDRLPSPLAKGQIAATLARLGDAERAGAAAQAATARPSRDFWYADYGSTVRDAAALVTVLGEVDLLGDRLPALLDRLPVGEAAVERTSTQEQAWIVLAGSTLLGREAAPPRLRATGMALPAGGPLFLAPTAAEIEAGVRIANLGSGEVWEAMTVMGVPVDPRPAAREGLTIKRRFLARDGKPLDLDQIRQNDVFIVELEGGATTGIDHQVLVTHGLPAGWEIENPRLGGADSDSFGWLGESSETKAVEARDDRYAAALDLTTDRPGFRLAFLVRAVTPGTYELPGAMVEDMYRPAIFARQAPGRIAVLAR
jgi:uncharacterized protein YfaS (alpha-2-macroglobulin family)